ncbi:voltage-gated potassium channel [Nemania serpens]|nr:voltage-gated potassium channel [Nemania serpens]
MEDANIDDAIADHPLDGHAKVTDGRHVDQTRWWFASAAFPMIAGSLGPMASAFSICALVKPWRQNILPGSDITKAVFIPDPSWLLAINAVQLAIAVISNLFLLLNMTKRVRFSIAQPITIIGWYISSLLLVALCATASGPLLPQHHEGELVWSQAFYYGLFAAVLYFIVASLMVITFWGASAGHYPKDFELTMSQRTLMLQTIVFLAYLLLGALVFSHIEGWLYLDAVYWADVTLFTVGLGDLAPKTNLGRGFVIPYALVGIITLGLVIGSIRSLMLDRGKKRLDARMLEKKRREFVRRLVRDGKGDVLEPITEKHPDYSPELGSYDNPQTTPQAELQRRNTEFHLMRKIQDRVSKRRRWMSMGIATGSWAVLWLVGAKIFQVCEGPYQYWSYFDGVYFSFQAMATIGYGDHLLVSNPGKAFFVFWSLLALPTLTILISNAGDTIIKGIRDTTVLLGNITILPGERGYKMDVKHFFSKLSFGVLFTEAIQETPPGFLGASAGHAEEDDSSLSSSSSESQGDEREKTISENKVPRRSSSGEPSRSNRLGSAASKIRSTKDKAKQIEKMRKEQKRKLEPFDGRKIFDRLPRTRAEYHLVLIDEIRRVSQHLQHTPPRQYTYQEWAWYLRLIGEDESDVATHRTLVHKPESSENGEPSRIARTRSLGGNTTDSRKQEGRQQWSWVGHRSPLMDTRDEAEWILDKLSMKLRQELQVALEESEGEDGVKNTEDMEDGHHHEKQINVPGRDDIIQNTTYI